MSRQTIQQNTLTNEQLFDAVVSNAIDFMYTSFANLEEQPKNSIVDFYTAVELFLKAKLMKEHWSLIISKPENADLTRFQQGDFHSVTLEQCVKRLRNIAGTDIPEEARTNFKALKEHRNQIVHFAHTDYSDKEKGRATVVIEQFKSWYHLHILLTDTCSQTFAAYKRKICRIHQTISGNKRFLSVRFDALAEDINQLRREGNSFVTCTFCECEGGMAKEGSAAIWGRKRTYSSDNWLIVFK